MKRIWKLLKQMKKLTKILDYFNNFWPFVIVSVIGLLDILSYFLSGCSVGRFGYNDCGENAWIRPVVISVLSVSIFFYLLVFRKSKNEVNKKDE